MGSMSEGPRAAEPVSVQSRTELIAVPAGVELPRACHD